MTSDFKFLDVGTLSDGEIELVVMGKIPADEAKGYAPAYEFDIRLRGKPKPIGRISLRVGNTKDVIMYVGHIGYGIAERHRGRRYAAKACKLVSPVAIAHGFKTLWITCDPDNVASRRTCEILGARLVEIVDPPEDNDMRLRGMGQKCRYRWDLAES
jgi:predicted acetyltransferase